MKTFNKIILFALFCICLVSYSDTDVYAEDYIRNYKDEVAISADEDSEMYSAIREHETQETKYQKPQTLASANWSTIKDLGLYVSPYESATYGTKVYVLGPAATAYDDSKAFYSYDMVSNTWTKLADIPVITFLHSMTAYNGKVYVIGGRKVGGADSDSVYIYNIATNSWSSGAPLPNSVSSPTATAYNGDIYVFGRPNGFNMYLYKYNIAANTWVRTTAWSTSWNSVDAVVFNNKIYIANAVRVYEFDPATQVATIVADYTSESHWPTVVASDNLIYIIDGYNDTISSGVSYIFNPKTKAIESFTDDTPLKISDAGSAYYNGNIFVLGSNASVNGGYKYLEPTYSLTMSSNVSGTSYAISGDNTYSGTITGTSTTLSNIPPGNYNITLSKAGYITNSSGSFSLTANTSKTVNLTGISYTVAYNSNGGTGTTASSTHTYGVAKNLTSNGFTKTGSTFLGWSTSSSATSPTYTNTQSISNLTTTNGTTITLYAVWSTNTYNVVYSANGGSGTTASSVHTYGVSKSLTSNGFSRAGYTFLGWSTNSSASTASYTNNQSVLNLSSTNNATVTLYAVWSINSYTLTGKIVNQWGTPVPDVNVYFNGKSVYTDSNGIFSITSNYNSASTNLAISKTGYKSKVESITNTSNVSKSDTIIEKSYYTVSGSVTDLDGSLIKNAIVTVNGLMVTFNTDGTYTIDIPIS